MYIYDAFLIIYLSIFAAAAAIDVVVLLQRAYQRFTKVIIL